MRQLNFWSISAIVIGFVWFISGMVTCCCVKMCTDTIVLIYVLQFIFLILLLLSLYLGYKVYRVQLEFDLKEKEYERKKELERLQKEKYAIAQSKKEEENDFNKRVEDACTAVLRKWENAYKENLKSLKSNMELYNEAKNIIEGKADVKEEEKKTPSEGNNIK